MKTMKDLIAERDKKEKMQHSVVKWWNVHYMTPEELEEQVKEEEPAVTESEDKSVMADAQPEMNAEREMNEEEADEAQDIIERLNRAAADKEAQMQKQIETMRMETEGNYNVATGSYSGSYGSGGADAAYQDQISSILAEKDDALRDLIERTEGDE